MTFNTLASNESVQKTVESLTSKGYMAVVVDTKDAALEHIKKTIPANSSVMNGSSVTLEQIGFVEMLKSGAHEWKNLHQAIIDEKDSVKQADLRRHSAFSDYYLGSVHALAESGEFVIGSNTGSQLPHIVFTSPNLIFVASTKKIVSSVDEGIQRLKEYVVPLEDEHMKQKYGMGTQLNKMLVFNGDAKFLNRKIHVILVQEDLGF